jgi:hypothetical protein
VKVLFLDIDGVLNSRSWADRYGDGWARRLDPEALGQLRRILDATGAVIVVSSAWRVGRSHIELREVLHDAGMSLDLVARIIDKTENLRGESRIGGHYRGDEIRRWLDLQGDALARRGRPVESFVVLDDGDDMTSVKHRLVQTDWAIGLTPELADRAIDLLSAAEPIASQEGK